MAHDARKSELIAELARARGELAIHARATRRELDFGARLKNSIRRHGLAWLGGGALFGILLTRLRSRKRVVIAPPRRWGKEPPEEKVVKAGLLITVAKMAFDVARPMLTRWVAGKVRDYADQRADQRARTRHA